MSSAPHYLWMAGWLCIQAFRTMAKTSIARVTGVVPAPIPVKNPIEAHGVIGDQRTAALIATDASIDFMCWPNFDSPTIFASLLDDHKSGFWEIAPQMKNARRKQLYLPDTNILVTRFSSPEGIVEITDFMPINLEGAPPRLVRRVCVTRGKIAFRMRCAPRFDYARMLTVAVADDQGGIMFK